MTIQNPAEDEGFEPPIRFHVCHVSNVVHSAMLCQSSKKGSRSALPLSIILREVFIQFAYAKVCIGYDNSKTGLIRDIPIDTQTNKYI